MTLDELFGKFSDNSNDSNFSTTALLTITSGSHVGMYPIRLKVVPSPPHKPGTIPATLDLKTTLQGEYESVIGNQSREFISLTVVQSLPRNIIGEQKGSFQVKVDHTDAVNFHPNKVTGVAAFSPNPSAHRDSPCQDNGAYFQSMETPQHLIQCCIPFGQAL